MSDDFSFQMVKKNPISLFLSKPITPKKLTMFMKPNYPQEPSFSQKICESFENPTKFIVKKKVLNKTLNLDSPVPEFAKEFLHSGQTTVLNQRKNSYSKRGSNPSTSPSCKNSFKTLIKAQSKGPISKSNTRSKSNLSVTDSKEPTLHKILRLFKPQIMKFKEKSHIQVFTTVSPAVKKSKVKLSRRLELLNEVHRKKKRPAKELSVEVFEPQEQYINDYTRPAITFGEKLWKLNEISVLNLN